MKIISTIILAFSFLFFFLIIRYALFIFLNNKSFISKSKRQLILLCITFIFIGLFIIVLIKSHQIEKKENLRIYNDSINNLKKRNFIDSVKYRAVTSRVGEFYKFSNLHIIDSVLCFYEDTIDRYFLLTNITKTTIRNQIKWYWRTYPSDKFIYERSSIDTIFYGMDSCVVTIYGINYKFLNKPVNIRTDIKFNKRFKIFYIRSFYDIDIESEMKLQTEQSKIKMKKLLLRYKHKKSKNSNKKP